MTPVTKVTKATKSPVGAARARKASPPVRRRKPPLRTTWRLRLYIAGMTPRSRAALENLKEICEQRIPGVYTIEVIDLLENPRLARGDQILAVPTLVRHLPPPVKKIIGDLSNSERVLVGLDLLGEGGE